MDDIITQIVETSNLGQWLYSSLTSTLLPVCVARVVYRAYLGKESISTLLERLGTSFKERPAGPVIWFHAANTSESAVALPVIFRCLLDYNENVHILLTTASAEAQTLLAKTLPSRVILQYIPLENPTCVRAFLQHWKPQVGIFMESELRPNLTLAAAEAGVKLALLNARLPSKMFLRWHSWRVLRGLMRQMINSFSLIIPQSDVDVGRFRMMGATLQQMPGWCADLKYASAMGHSVWHMWKPAPEMITSLKQGAAGKNMWLAANTHEGEEAAIGRVHAGLKKDWPNLLTVILPRPITRCPEVALLLKGQGLKVGFWSSSPRNYDADVLLVDSPTDLPLLYSVCELVFVGNSLLDGGTGHSFAEAAVAGCAVLVGEHCGHFSSMADELNQAAVLAAEEAAAAVTSSGPLNDEYMDAFTSSAPAGSHTGAGNTPRAVPTPPVPSPTTPPASAMLPSTPAAGADPLRTGTQTGQHETCRPSTAPARIVGSPPPNSFEFACPPSSSTSQPPVSTSGLDSYAYDDSTPTGLASSPLHSLLHHPAQVRFATPTTSGPGASCPPRVPTSGTYLSSSMPMVRAGVSTPNSADPGSSMATRLPLRPLVPYRSAGEAASRVEEGLHLFPDEGSPCSSTIPIGSPSHIAGVNPSSPTICSTSEHMSYITRSNPSDPSYDCQQSHTTTTFTAYPASTPRNDDCVEPIAVDTTWACKEPGPNHQYWLASATSGSGAATAGLPMLHVNAPSHTNRTHTDSRVEWDTVNRVDVQTAGPVSPTAAAPCSVLSMPPHSWSPRAGHDGDMGSNEGLMFTHTFLRPSPFCSSPSESSPTSGISTGLLRPSPLIPAPPPDSIPGHTTRTYPPVLHMSLNPYGQPGSNLLEPAPGFAHNLLAQDGAGSHLIHLGPHSSPPPAGPAYMHSTQAFHVAGSPAHPTYNIPTNLLYSPDPPSLYQWVPSPSPVRSMESIANCSASSQPVASPSSLGAPSDPTCSNRTGATSSSPPVLFSAPQPQPGSTVTRPLDFFKQDWDSPRVGRQLGLGGIDADDILSPYHPGSNDSTPRSRLEHEEADVGTIVGGIRTLSQCLDGEWDAPLRLASEESADCAGLLLPPPSCVSPTKSSSGEPQRPGHRWMPTEISLSEWDGVSSDVLTLDTSHGRVSPSLTPPLHTSSHHRSSSYDPAYTSPSSPHRALVGEGQSYGSPRRRWARRHVTSYSHASTDAPDSPQSVTLNPSLNVHHISISSSSSQDTSQFSLDRPRSTSSIVGTSSTAFDVGSSPWQMDNPTSSQHHIRTHAPSPLRPVSNVSTSNAGPMSHLRRLRSPVIGSPRAAAANLVHCPLYSSNTEEDEEVYAPVNGADRSGGSGAWGSRTRHTRSLSPGPRSPFSTSSFRGLRLAHARSGGTECESESTPNWLATPTPTSTSFSDTGLLWRTSASSTMGEHSWTAADFTRPSTAAFSVDGTMDAETPSAAGMKPNVAMNKSPAATSYMRYAGDYILPATHLPYMPHGPAVWKVNGESGLSDAIGTLLREPLERRSRGHAAAQAAAKLASGLVSTVWHFLDDMVITPALQDYVRATGQDTAAVSPQTL